MRPHSPQLRRIEGPVEYSSDEGLAREWGIHIAFTGRRGGVSVAPYDSLNLAAHVGDEPGSVDENRRRALAALGMGTLADRLVAAEQVHGARIAVVEADDAGRGAHAALGAPPIARADGLMTRAQETPLLMQYADCVPIVLVGLVPVRAVCVVHAGWRGALAGIAGKAAAQLGSQFASVPEALMAYIGPHARSCCYTVGDGLLSQFERAFGTICAVDGRLDLEAAVREDLRRAGVPDASVVSEASCTLDQADRFFSYRATRVTGRHGALAVIAKVE